MRMMVKLVLVLAAVAGLGALLVRSPATATASVQASSPVMQALVQDIEQVEGKLLALAEAIPASSYDWRPAEGVRSVGEVLGHVAADNWFLPAATGVPAPGATGITGDSYESVQAYEARTRSRDEAVAEVRESFRHLKEAMNGAEETSLDEPVEIFGQQFTGLEVWVLTTTHLHEHLGQLIAYARMNGVVPPWSG